MDDSNENTQLLDEEDGSETEIFTADRNKKGEDFRGEVILYIQLSLIQTKLT